VIYIYMERLMQLVARLRGRSAPHVAVPAE
jgi:hypothetical protein